MDTLLTTLNQIRDYVFNRIYSFLTRGVPADEAGVWIMIEIAVWNLAHFYLIAFILQKWIHLDERQTLIVMFLLLFWDTIGATLLIMYILHQAFNHLFASNLKLLFTKSGGKTTASPPPTPTPSPTVLVAVENASDSKTNNSTDHNNNNNAEALQDQDEDDDIFSDEKEHDQEDIKDANEISSPNNNKNNNKKDKVVKKKSQKEARTSTSTSTTTVSTTTPPKMKSTAQHPGLKGFHVWMEAMTDIYRGFFISKRDQDGDVYPNISRSERGRAAVSMSVTNKMYIEIDAFWLDFKGHEKHKAIITPNGGNIQITTWVGHPWIFRARETGRMLLYYVPYRVIPNIDSSHLRTSSTRNRYDRYDTSVGRHDFAIVNPKVDSDLCAVEDELLPFPSTRIKSVNHALEFSCQQLERDNVIPKILLKYLYNIMLEPNESKYRQIRVANKAFWNNVWCNGGRGVLEALGFEENGAFVEMGPSEGPLPPDRLKDLASAIVMLDELKKDMEDTSKPRIEQPQGANGSGRGLYRDL